MIVIKVLRVMGILVMLAGAAFWFNIHGIGGDLRITNKLHMKIIGGILFYIGLSDIFVIPYILRRRMR